MKRTDILYGDGAYSVGGRDLGELQAEITRGVADGGYWLKVNHGEGGLQEAYLLLTSGTPVALIPIPGDDSAG